MEPTESRKAEVLEALDLSSEQISLDQMKAWWNSDKVTYEVRRDSGVSLEFLPHGKSSAMPQYTPLKLCERSVQSSFEQCGA